MDEYDDVNPNLLVSFWVYLAYFLAFVGIMCGWKCGVQSWIYYGLFFVLFGLGLNISSNLIIVKDILSGANIEYDFYEDSD